MTSINNTSTTFLPTQLTTMSYVDGYDLPIKGLSEGKFMLLHMSAITCILISLVSVIVIFILASKRQNIRQFFAWSKHERFVMYLALCDGFFNVCHSMDHLHMTLAKDHVRPRRLCQFYGFMVMLFCAAQYFLVFVVALNAFLLIYYRIVLKFGTYDWRLLLWTFGSPLLLVTIALCLGGLGPTGSFCAYDPIKGRVLVVAFSALPTIIVLVTNVILYTLTWYRIRTEEPRFKTITGRSANNIRASHRVARASSLFVVAFVMQWWTSGAWSFVIISGNVASLWLTIVTVVFTNLGGFYNIIVYLLLNKEQKVSEKDCVTAKSTTQI